MSTNRQLNVTLVATSSSSSTSTSTTSSGGASSPTATKLTKVFGILNADEESSFTLSSAAIAIRKIAVTTKENIQIAKVTVERLTSKPSSIEAPNGKVYQYLDITAEQLTEDVLKEVKIRFEVNQTWLLDNGYDIKKIKLARYKEGWNILPTTKETTNLNTYTFEATTPGFSHFAIIGEGKSTQTTTTTTSNDQTNETIPPEETSEILTKTGNWFKEQWTIILWVIGGIIILTGLVFLWIKIRKKKGKPLAPFKTKLKK